MASQSVLVTDTNIWIDLENGGVLVEVFQLPYRFFIPDFAIRELIQPGWEVLEALGLRVHELPAEKVIELSQLRQIHRNLSVVDLAALLVAQLLDATLVTGDRRLNELAKTKGISVRGVLWLLDELVNYHIVKPWEAHSALDRMIEAGSRLPADECKRRFMQWPQ